VHNVHDCADKHMSICLDNYTYSYIIFMEGIGSQILKTLEYHILLNIILINVLITLMIN